MARHWGWRDEDLERIERSGPLGRELVDSLREERRQREEARMAGEKPRPRTWRSQGLYTERLRELRQAEAAAKALAAKPGPEYARAMLAVQTAGGELAGAREEAERDLGRELTPEELARGFAVHVD